MTADRVLKIALAAEESAGVQVLRALLKSPHELSCVLTSAPAEGEEVRGATVWHVATKAECDVLSARKVRSRRFADELRERGVDLLLNVHSLYIIRAAVLAAPRVGAFNLHPGPLPRYAGLDAPSWALLHGEKQHGVTVHWMEPGIDTGDIAYQELFDVGEHDTGLKVSANCIRRGVKLFEKLLADAPSDSIPRVAQDLSQRSYFLRKRPNDLDLDWHRPVQALYDALRATDFHPLTSPWGAARTMLDREVVEIIKAKPAGQTNLEPGELSVRDGRVLVGCGDDEALELTLLRIDGKTVKAGEHLQTGGRFERVNAADDQDSDGVASE